MTDSADVERLLVHADWLRALARKLVGSGSADDAVQDAYVTAMRSPPDQDRPARPWLARVVHNAARMRFRAESRRTRREDASAMLAPDAVAGADVVVQRLETHRALVDVVLELHEPFRTTIVRHYFDGVTMAEIARSDGVPEATVRWRHTKALEQLRVRLDARSGGDRRAWIVALAPMSTPAKATAVVAIGGVVANKIVIGSVVAIAAIVGGIVVWQRPDHAAVSDAPASAPPRGRDVPSARGIGSSGMAGQLAPPARVVKLASPDDRRRLVDRIASARADHHGAGPRPSLPDVPVESSPGVDRATLRDAMREVIPFLAECYSDALPVLGDKRLEITAQLSLDGDRDVGTIVDAKQVVDETGLPLPAKLDDCLRSTLQSLELPPLAEGDHVDVAYPFVFTPN